MFNHKIALNGAILEGASKVFNQYGGFTMSDFLDIEWYVDTDWVDTFETILKHLNDGTEEKLWSGRYEYEVSLDQNYYVITSKDVRTESDAKKIAQIPNFLPNDLFLYLSTLLKGDYEW